MSVLSVLLSWLSAALCIWLAALLPGFEVKQGFKGAAIAATVLWLLNLVATWLLFGFLDIDHALHMSSVFEALSRWVVMALLLLATARMTKAISVQTFPLAFLAAVLITVSSRFVTPVIGSLLSLEL